jgi:hypothetical protein
MVEDYQGTVVFGSQHNGDLRGSGFTPGKPFKFDNFIFFQSEVFPGRVKITMPP